MFKFSRVALALAFLSGASLGPAVIVTEADAAQSTPVVKRPPKPPSTNGVCWHWSGGKWTAHPC